MRGIIDTPTLETLINTHTHMMLIDARGEAEQRIPGAKFLSAKSTVVEIEETIGSKETLVVTYCANLKCPASEKMADHLSDLGYQNVLEYAEGILGWTEAGHKTEPAIRRRTVTFQGSPLHLIGRERNVGDTAPNVTLAGTDLQPVQLDDFKNQIVVLVTVPSLDTPVCDLETRTFNKKATDLSDEVKILVASMDLPFAQKRWCGAGGINNVVTLSDYRGAILGRAYGVLIEELYLLARTIFVIDQSGVIRYRQIVGEIADEPDYDEALQAVDNLLTAQKV
jgi:thiol peroxidase